MATLEIRPYKLCELAEIYDMKRDCFRKWLKPFDKEIGGRNGHYYTPQQVMIIVEKLGMPQSLGNNF